ncbi:hypothetical protein, partial [Aminipila sp.]|uniref:hypothetical protein n=1 Tax=Aminipila sp. TaxID=2060095 RepID=UPI003FA4305C
MEDKSRKGPSGHLRFEREEQAATSGQVGPKSGKLRQDSNKPRPSERLWRDGEPPPGGEAAGDGAAPHTGSNEKKAAKDGKRMEKSRLRMEKSGERLNTACEKLAAQKPPKKPGPIKTVGRAAQ